MKNPTNAELAKDISYIKETVDGIETKLDGFAKIAELDSHKADDSLSHNNIQAQVIELRNVMQASAITFATFQSSVKTWGMVAAIGIPIIVSIVEFLIQLAFSAYIK